MSYVFVPTPSPERALTAAQRRALLALKQEAELDAASVARAAGLKPNGAALALRGLERRGLAAPHDEDARVWTVTFAGHALAQRLAQTEPD
jgi:hypothetical protein